MAKFELDIWKNKETYEYNRNWRGIGDEPEEPIYASVFNGEWFANQMGKSERSEIDNATLCAASAQAYRDLKNPEWAADKKNIKYFADQMFDVYFKHAEWYNLPKDAFIVIFKIKD